MAGELLEMPLEQAATAIRSGALSARDYCEAFIARSERCAHLNALTSWDWDRLRAQADAIDAAPSRTGALLGVPLALKDNIDTAALPTTGGTGALQGFVPAADAPVAARLFSAGALLGAKAGMHELAFGITSNNAVTGASHNPYDPDRIPGGSSGGVASAVAAGMMPAGIGTDTGASVRLPAALCGLVGLRPTVGRYPGAGIVPISHTRDTPGPMTRTVADAAYLDGIVTGDDAPLRPASLPGLRLGIPRAHFFEDLDAEVERIADAALARLEAAGVELVEVDPRPMLEINARVGFPIALYEVMRDLPAYLDAHGTGLTMNDILDGIASPDVRGIVASQMGEAAMPEAAYRQALDVDRPLLVAVHAALFADNRVEALLFPTAPLPAAPIGEDETVELNGTRVPTFATFIRNTDSGSNAGIPGISVPAGLTASGLPVGMELDGPASGDRRLLAIAAAVEEVLDARTRPPLVRSDRSHGMELA